MALDTSNPGPFVSSEVETPCAALVACFSTSLETNGKRDKLKILRDNYRL